MRTINTLALETSVQPGSIALLRDNVTVYESDFPKDQRTTQSFALEIQSALRQSDLQPRDIDLFAVCQGPGSFTGLRIGVTTAKTFAYATDCQILGIDTLEVIANQATKSNSGELEVIMDAQRRQLFVASFLLDKNAVIRRSETAILDADRWLAERPGNARVTGPALRLYATQLPAETLTTDASCWTPTATTLAEIASQRFAAGERQDFWKLAPVYYRQSAAEEKFERQNK